MWGCWGPGVGIQPRLALPTRWFDVDAPRGGSIQSPVNQPTPRCSAPAPAATHANTNRSSPLSQYGGVHGSRVAQKTWRNKPLFRREGDARFRTGAEAADMLVAEVKRRDAHETEFLQAFSNAMTVLAPVFERVRVMCALCGVCK